MTARKKATNRRRRSAAGLSRVRRRTQRVSTSIGAALGTLAVTLLLDASWPVRVALVAAVLVIGLAIVAIGNRRASARTVADLRSQPSGIRNDIEPQGDSTHD